MEEYRDLFLAEANDYCKVLTGASWKWKRRPRESS